MHCKMCLSGNLKHLIENTFKKKTKKSNSDQAEIDRLQVAYNLVDML